MAAELVAAPSAAASGSDTASAPTIAGTAARNENSAAVSRSAPATIAAAIVAPEREMPGSTATPCTTPTSNAHGQRGCQCGRGSAAPRSTRAATRTAAVASSMSATKRGSRGTPSRCTTIPTPPVATVASSSNCRSRRSGVRSAWRRAGGRNQSAAALTRSARRRRNTTPTAARVDRCSSTSNSSGTSPTPSIRRSNTRCPELETGRNSVAPWSAPSSADCHTLRFTVALRQRSRPGYGAGSGGAAPPGRGR